ncbi:dna-binding protein : AAA ATPase central domain protein OS=Planctomyces limnophilus (strain ATCC 43296 / DSM 3776 / IFAM 1008 / 290) GN=Plim_2108 PE=4 SV=1: AAA [Gemmata massiliana]|uniref:AAA+ ATPase domain-containing protein n=1 Tax=Gemmata massiliana TaxID=1210884 RepID=A0A6P2DAF7_9BACT|nr:ATP-binding protein [Gemmata massiliana]VTR97867.1 dna-binding protein : AAA ATPase central domain protein OS=Planctomyces limnophilus (strain ATCC 43296 / DSM 3776 / IFAM 1008 / 290) GN=Plim_2108 PE=4 SV=1: AAA [Gemmata massiliana]
MLREFLFDVAKIVEGATNSDLQKVASYTAQLADRLEGAGETEAANRIRRILQNSKAGTLGLTKATGHKANAALPVDTESRLPVADEERPMPGEVKLVLSEASKRALEQFLKFFRAAGRLVAHGVGVSPSILLYGPPGCGKTQLARYVAAELSLPLITARTDSLISSYLGSTSKNIRQLFDHAASRPCVLFLDEFDALAKMRDDGRELGELKRVVISLLQNIDALGTDHVLIAATNHEHLLDPAIWRRFHYKLKLTEPDFNGRAAMAATFFGSFATPELAELVAAISDGMTGAQLRQVAEDCVRASVLADQNQVTAPQAIHAMLAANPNTPLASATVADQLRALRTLDKKRFTQARLASIFGYSQSWVSDLLRSNT